MATYTIKSVKHSERFEGTVAEAIERAEAIESEYQPSYGVQIEDGEGSTIWDSEEPASAGEWESAAGNTMGGMTVDSRRYHIVRYQAGCAPIYCGTMYGLSAARFCAATEPDGISQDLWATSRIAPIYNLVAPEIDEDAEALEWHGADGTWGIFAA